MCWNKGALLPVGGCHIDPKVRLSKTEKSGKSVYFLGFRRAKGAQGDRVKSIKYWVSWVSFQPWTRT